jgi:hypothetical protein
MGVSAMVKFFQMTYVDDKKYKPFGVANIPSEIDPFLLPVSGISVDSWRPFDMSLKEGILADYLANDLGARLCSERMRDTIESCKLTADVLQWLNVQVVDDSGMPITYYILHFPKNFHVVSQEHSLFAGDMVVKPVLEYSVSQHLSIFTLPNEGGITTFVSSSVKEAMESSELTGMDFEKVNVA